MTMGNSHYDTDVFHGSSPASSKMSTPPPPPPRKKFISLQENADPCKAQLLHRSDVDEKEKDNLFDNSNNDGNDGGGSKRRIDVIRGDNYIHIDRFFLGAMPILFLIFNIVYWLFYGSHFFLTSNQPTEKY